MIHALKRHQITGLNILFAITAAGVVPCGGPKKSPRKSSIVQIIFLLRSFEISKYIQSQLLSKVSITSIWPRLGICF